MPASGKNTFPGFEIATSRPATSRTICSALLATARDSLLELRAQVVEPRPEIARGLLRRRPFADGGVEHEVTIPGIERGPRRRTSAVGISGGGEPRPVADHRRRERLLHGGEGCRHARAVAEDVLDLDRM